MKIFIAIALFFISATSFATTRLEAVQIYNNILRANNIYSAPKLKFSSSSEMNAYQSGWDIVVFQGMLNNTNRDELALVIGHELAHYKLWHVRSTHKNEYAADAKGWEYASKAGYNVCKGKNLFKKFRKGASSTHPDPRDRINRLPKC